MSSYNWRQFWWWFKVVYWSAGVAIGVHATSMAGFSPDTTVKGFAWITGMFAYAWLWPGFLAGHLLFGWPL